MFELYHKVNKITAYSKTWPGLIGMARPHWPGFKIGPAHFWPQIWLGHKFWPRFNNWSGLKFGIYNIRLCEMLNSSAGIGSEETDIKFLLGREISAWLVYTGNVCNLAILKKSALHRDIYLMLSTNLQLFEIFIDPLIRPVS